MLLSSAPALEPYEPFPEGQSSSRCETPTFPEREMGDHVLSQSVSEGSNEVGTEEMLATAAAAAAAEAAKAQEIVSDAVSRTLRVKHATAVAQELAVAQRERLRCAQARSGLLARQIEELESEAETLRGEEVELQAMLARRRAVQTVDEGALSEKVKQMASERADAQRGLRLKLECASAARERVLLLEGGDESSGGSAHTQQEAMELEEARLTLGEAQAALAQSQTVEAAHEFSRRQQLDTRQQCYERNADLAAIDAEAAQASTDAVRLRLKGKVSQVSLLHPQLDEALAAEASEQSGVERTERLADEQERSLRLAAELLQAEHERAQSAMATAASAANASLRAVSTRALTHGLGQSNESMTGASPELHAYELQGQLRAAGEEADRWRRAAVELQVKRK